MAQEDWRLFLRDASVVRVETKKKKKTAADTKAGAAVKKKRKTSPGVMHVLGVAEQRILRGVAKAGGSYAKKSKKSAAKKDGAVRDLLTNVAKAQEGAIGQLAKIPRDLVKARELKRGSKQVRKSVRRIAY